MKPRLLRLALVALPIIALSLPLPARAADEPQKKQPPEADRNLPRQATPISIEFAGGSVSDLVATVNKHGVHLNLIGEKDDMATPLPAFSVRNVSPANLAMALRHFLEPRGIMVMTEAGETFILRRFNTMRPHEPTRFESFQLAPYLEKQSIDDIVSAIRTAWELNPQNSRDALQLKFHPQTKLLLVSGSGEAIMVASKVISTLVGAPEKAPRESPAAASPTKR